MSFLGTLRTGVEVAGIAVFWTVEADDFLLAGADAERRQVHRVGTHVGDMSALVEALCHHHRLRNGEAKLAGGFLLQSTGGERRCRHALHGLAGDALHDELGILALLEEGQCLVVGLKAVAERGKQGGTLHFQLGADVEVGLALEGLNLALALNDESHGDTLHSACRQRRLHLAPKHRRQLEAHQAVEHAACLLCVNEVHIDMARVLNGSENGRLCNLVEHDTIGLLLVETQHFAQVPRDGFSLAVFIACEPNLLGFLRVLLQFADEFLLLVGYFVVGHQRVVVDTDFFLLQVTNVAVARHYLEVFS